MREERGLSRADIAKTLACAVAKVGHMENAERGVQEDDLAKLLDLYEVPKDRQSAYVQACRDARRKGWWDRYDERTLPDWLSLYVGLEQGASQLRAYEPHLVHGLLQTPEYAAAVMRSDPIPRTDERIAEMTQLRTERQAALTRSDDPLALWVVLDESALRRVVGSRKIMAAQLRHVADLAEGRSNVIVQVLPFGNGAHLGTKGPFVILGFPWEVDRGVAYFEYHGGAIYRESVHEIEEHTLIFQHLVAVSAPPSDSIAMLRAAEEEYAPDD